MIEFKDEVFLGDDPDLGDQSFEDFFEASDFEDPFDEYEQFDGVGVWNERVDND